MVERLGLDLNQLRQVEPHALCVLSDPSDLRNEDVLSLFDNKKGFKQRDAEAIINILLGTAKNEKFYFNKYGKARRDNTLLAHAAHFRKQANGGPDGEGYRAFATASFLEYTASITSLKKAKKQGKKLAPKKKKSGSKVRDGELVHLARKAIAERGMMAEVMVQQQATVVEQALELQQKDRHIRQLEHENEQQRQREDATFAQLEEVDRLVATQGKQLQQQGRQLQQKEKTISRMQATIAATPRVPMARAQAETVRAQREAAKEKAAKEKAEQRAEKEKEARQRAELGEREQRNGKRKAERERDEARKDRRILRITNAGMVSRAVHETAVRAQQLQREKAEREKAEMVLEMAPLVEKAEQLGKRTTALEARLAVCRGKKRGRLTRDLQRVREEARDYWLNTYRSKPDELTCAYNGQVTDLWLELTEAESKAAELDALKLQFENKEKLVTELQSKLTSVGPLKRVNGMYPNRYRKLLMSCVGNCSSVYQARTMVRFVIKHACGWMKEGTDFEVPELNFLKNARRDIQPLTETLAAIKVAKCDRIIQLGSDGSSLRGTDTYTVNLKLFTRVDGGGRVLGTGEGVEFAHEDVCLSASALPQGKTSEEEAEGPAAEGGALVAADGDAGDPRRAVPPKGPGHHHSAREVRGARQSMGNRHPCIPASQLLRLPHVRGRAVLAPEADGRYAQAGRGRVLQQH